MPKKTGTTDRAPAKRADTDGQRATPDDRRAKADGRPEKARISAAARSSEQLSDGASAVRARLRNKDYLPELIRLQLELVKLQEWIRHQGLNVVVIFEGRDAAGKGGVIKTITQSLNPRICRVVALPAPSEPDGPPVALAVARLFTGEGRDVRALRHQAGTVVRGQRRRQETCPAQLHQPPAGPDPVQGPDTRRDRAAAATGRHGLRPPAAHG